MSNRHAWLGVALFEIDPEGLKAGVQEGECHKRMKYAHRQAQSIVKPTRYELPPRIQTQIENMYSWYDALYDPQGKSSAK